MAGFVFLQRKPKRSTVAGFVILHPEKYLVQSGFWLVQQQQPTARAKAGPPHKSKRYNNRKIRKDPTFYCPRSRGEEEGNTPPKRAH